MKTEKRYIKQLAGKLIAEGLSPYCNKKDALNAVKNCIGANFLTEIINQDLKSVKNEMQTILKPIKNENI